MGSGADLIYSSSQLNWMQIHTWVKKGVAPYLNFTGNINFNPTPETATANVETATQKRVSKNNQNQSVFTVVHVKGGGGRNNVICLDFGDFLPQDKNSSSGWCCVPRQRPRTEKSTHLKKALLFLSFVLITNTKYLATF